MAATARLENVRKRRTDNAGARETVATLMF
jgi:hypothetical protein